MKGDLMRLGFVSNCWNVQLEEGESLYSLIQQATTRGYEVVELRQSSLGDTEGDDGKPIVPSLRQLSADFPQVEFNVAAALPFLSGGLLASSDEWLRWREAACAVPGASGPHLRLVDLETAGDASFDINRIAERIVALTESMIEVQGLLSLEHSLQPWRPFYDAFRTARIQLGDNHTQLRICFDPCNLFLPDDQTDPVQVTQQLAADEISMLHFKQWTDDQIAPRVAMGRIDWNQLLQIVSDRKWQCPGLFEIRSSANIWAEAAESYQHLTNCGLSTNSAFPWPEQQ